MSEEPTHLITKLLAGVGRGEGNARERLWEVVYSEVHRLARIRLAREPAGKTLQPTALVNEAYLRLAGGDCPFANRRHFFAAVATAMHRIIVDDARRHGRLKRGGRATADTLEEEPAVFDRDPAEVLAVDEALTELEGEHPELAELVRHRYFSALSMDQTAEVMGVSRRTIGNRWRLARALLYEALSDSGKDPQRHLCDEEHPRLEED